jgi:hypothetical protein
MAKKKRSAALFEVMVKQEQRRLPQPPGMFRTLILWFKNRPQTAPAPLVTSVLEREEATERVISEVPLAPVMREVEGLPPEPEPEPARLRIEPRSAAVTVQRAGGWLALRLSYGTVIITAFALATVVISAFLIGKRWQNRPQTVLAATTTPELRRQAPRANLTDVRRVSNPPPAQYTADPADVMANNAAATSGSNVAGNAPPARPKERELGFNYIMIQSYPEEKMAIAAAAALRQNGIDCTVEKGIPGFFRFSVVGQIGFSRISNNPQLEAYLNKIRAISEAYAKKPNSFAAFKPQPVKWQAWQRKAE